MTPVELIIHAGWVVPVEPIDVRLPEHAVVVDGGRIIDVLPSAEADARYAPASVVDRRDHLVMPGLVNAHTHAAMNLMRGIANDKPLMPWLTENIWPIESNMMSADFVADGTDLAIAEMLAGGTTCFNDMYFFPDTVAERVDAAGIRATLGLIALDFPTVWANDANGYIEKGLAVHEQWRNHARLNFLFAPHAPYTISDAPLARIRTLADEMDIGIHMHVHETRGEVDDALAQHGQRPLARLAELGLLNPNFIAVHMTQITDAEIESAANHGIQVVHSPESNLKLASGLCPTQRLAAAGVNLALGTDGAASNNDLDMIGEMRTAALTGKIAADDATAINAVEALAMATIGGARALGLGQVTGSITPGKAADLCAIDLNRLATTPVYDPVDALVYSASRDQVTDTWVNGQRLFAEGRLTTIDSAEVVRRARVWQRELAGYI